MNKPHRQIGRIVALVATSLALASGSVRADTYYYVDWTSWNPGGGTAVGTITPSGGSPVTVNFDAYNANGSHGSFAGVAGNWLWNPAATYTSPEVSNASTYEALQLVGNTNMTYRVTLSEAIKDPIMSIASLGSRSDSAAYVFDSPFSIVSQGPTCCWGGDGDNLWSTGNTLYGTEGAGTIKFLGTYSTFSWTVPDPENWHGFTFGIRTTEALEPTTPIPEPETYAMMLAGLGLLGLRLRRRKLASH